MHQPTPEPGVLDLKPPALSQPATTIEAVLEEARLRAVTRELESRRPRLLPNLAPEESRFVRIMWLVIAIGLVWAHFYLVRSFWAPAHPGVDQNGYQVGGKLFSQTFSTGFKPPNPFAYVGWMWVLSPDGWMYPKYPLGVPILDALCIWIAPTFKQGIAWSYLVSPISTVLASAAMFLMLRMFTSSFSAVMGLLLMAMNPVALVLANNSNSHAPALAFASWGILFLLWWMRYGGAWLGFVAGLLLGYAVTIRYTEGLLVLPMIAAMITSIRWRRPRTILAAFWPALGWLIPVGGLVAFNWFAMQSVTGYDTTNESTGFSWKNFVDKWDFMVGQVYNTGLFFVVPLGIAGMILMYRKAARVALVMTLWFVPGLLLYAAYYWGLNTPGVGYLRFFLTIFPPMVFCAAWLLDELGRRGVMRGSFAGPIAAGIVVAMTCGMNAYSSRGAMARDFTIQTNLADASERILGLTKNPYETDPKQRAILFGEGRGLLNYMQYASNFECYNSDAFAQRGGNRFWRNVDPDAPNPLQRKRVDAMRKVYENKSEADLWREGTKIMDQALADKRHVYAALPAMMMTGFRSRFSANDYKLDTIATWREPVTMSDDARKAFNALGPAVIFAGFRAAPQNWELIEITKNTSPGNATTAPAPPLARSRLARMVARLRSRPATAPATKPIFEIK